jgi:23S rRNA G2445 N2-methylase RlmL
MTLKALALTPRGCEDIAALEILELLNTKAVEGTGYVTFSASSEDLLRIAFLGQSIERVISIIDEFESDDIISEMTTRAPKWPIQKPYSTWCSRSGDHDFSSSDVYSTFAETIGNPSYKVKAGSIAVIIRNNHCFVGVDIAGVDTSKRDYKVFANRFSLKGPLAYCLVRLTGVKEGTVIDPYSRDGTIAIEAALFAKGQGPNKFRTREFPKGIEKVMVTPEAKKLKVISSDSMNSNLQAAKKNATIAQVHREVQVRHYPVQDLDWRLNEPIDAIITSVNAPTEEFWKVAPKIFEESGIIAILHTKEFDVPEVVKQLERREVWMGKRQVWISILESVTISK